ncbi:hypothetical protein [Nocardioides sp. TF02-7]|uniref:hypothetical protein n=1 Tax=Nocardioides sp. TF02-7 TaxID=2917724 RepID=UPI001F05F6D1|nr:hypothetical protein [Nocardioides sp. TF02-7]UMG91492.1 hypothetical protein MF408_15360 [Nocardioides sp. TF02-7]
MYADLVLLIAAQPEDEDVVAGPIGALVFFGLVVAVALLLWSFTRRLKKVDRAREEGVYGDPPSHERTDAADDGSAGSGDSGSSGGDAGGSGD